MSEVQAALAAVGLAALAGVTLFGFMFFVALPFAERCGDEDANAGYRDTRTPPSGEAIRSSDV